MSAANKKLIRKVNKMSFDMLLIEKDRLMEVEDQLKKLKRSQRKTLIDELKKERARLIISIETMAAKRAKNSITYEFKLNKKRK